MNEIIELQQFWLRNQSELVKTIKDVQRQSGDMEYLKKQYTILMQKKLRIEGMGIPLSIPRSFLFIAEIWWYLNLRNIKRICMGKRCCVARLAIQQMYLIQILLYLDLRPNFIF